MARLALIFDILEESHRMDVRQRRNLRRIARYTDKAFAMTDEEFKRNYRVNRDLFEVICADLESLMPRPTRRSDISSKYKILVALSFYATGSYQRLVGGTQGTMMSQQSVSRAIMEVTAALNSDEMLSKWLKFPQTRLQRDSIKRRFYEKYKIPSVLGCIDGTHIAIVRPNQNEEHFYNRKGFHSRNVLIICDADLNILSVDASFGGATHDSFVWNQNPIKEHLENLRNAGESVFLLGDSGYPQRDFLMTPIVDALPGSPEEYYTKLHCTARNTVERTIGLLKNRWRCLLGHRVLHYHPDKAAKIINACCVLHNICNIARLSHDDLEEMATPPIQVQVSQEPIETEQLEATASAELRRGYITRAHLVQELWEARRLHI